MDGNTWEGWEKWERSEEGFAALREPHTGLAADSCCKTSSSASRFKERGGGAGCDGSRSIGETRGGADGVGTVVTVRGRC